MGRVLWQFSPAMMWRRFCFAFAHAHPDAGYQRCTYTIAHHRTRAVCECGASEWWG